jgi:hypothetical protein
MQSQFVSAGASMDQGRFLFRVLAAAVLLCGGQTFAQQMNFSSARGGAEGRLTVTATVISSVGLVVGPDGEQRMIISNAYDPKDNVSRLQPVVTVKLMPVEDRERAKPAKKKHSNQR